MKNHTLEHALKYRALGWSIIPIKAGSKLPALSSWTPYKNKIADNETITKWFSNTDNGIALVCGKVSGVIAVDIDVKNGEPDLKGLELPITLSAKTGSNGTHMLYKWREGLIGAAVGIRKGVDIRSDNSYIVVAPSIHPNGKAYEWINEGETIAEAPKWLESIESPRKKSKKLSEVVGVEKGSRNEKMASAIGKLLMTTKSDKWDDEVFPTIIQLNETYKPPLEMNELVTIWDSITSKEKSRLSSLPKSDNDEEAEIVKSYIKSKKKGTYDLAMYIVRKYNIVTIGEVEREIYVYRNGLYSRAENEIIYPEIQRILKDLVDKSAKLEVLHKIQDATYKNRDVFKSAPLNLIPLNNGVYDLETGRLLPHSSEYYFTFQFPVIYNPKAQCENSIKFLHDVLNDEQFAVVQEWLGYYFYRIYAFKKAIIFVGEGDTGKTTLLEMITYLLGRNNISSISLQKITGDKFAGAQMYEKHGNIVDELSAKDIHDTGQFKMATGGGSINGEYKFGNQFSFLNYSKLTFACNKIPDVKEMDDQAYFNRWMVIRFSKIIEKKIPNFISRLTIEEERSGLFIFAMEGLRRLLAQGQFSYAKSAIDTKLEMLRSGSSIAQFVSERIEESQGTEISKDAMYKKYAAFCLENNLDTETMDNFGKKFALYVSYVSDGLITDPLQLDNKGLPRRVRGWRNASVIETEEEKMAINEAINDFNGFEKVGDNS